MEKAHAPSRRDYTGLGAVCASLYDADLSESLVLVVGTILAQGRRTVTSALQAVGHTQTADWAKYHHVLNRACWSGLQVSRLLLAVLVATWCPAGQVTRSPWTRR